MRILFVVTGLGYGDTIRIQSILDELHNRVNGLDVLFLAYNHSYDYFHKKYPTLKIGGYNFSDKKMEFKTNRFILRNFYLPLKWASSYLRYKKKIQEFDPDIIISDFEPIANIISSKLGRKCITIFGYDPKLFEKYPEKNKRISLQAKYIEQIYDKSDIVIVPDFKKKENYGNINYVNPIIAARPSELPSKQELMNRLRLKKEPILVMLGGSDYGVSLAKNILKIITNFNEEFIFFGSKKKIPGFHFKFAKNFLEYLKTCKAVITLGGKLTISECLVFKKPMLVFPIKNHIEQLLNAYSIRNVSVQGDVNDIEGSIKKLLDNVNDLNEKLNSLDIKPNGAEETADIIISEINRLE